MNHKDKFSIRSMVILIPVVAMLIVSIFLINYNIYERGKVIKYVLHALFMTAALWIGCMTIVKYLWHKYPWEQTPVVHLIYEVILIAIYTMIVGSADYFLEKQFSYLETDTNMGMEIFITFLITYLITSIYESVFFYLQWKENFSRSARLERDNIRSKYEILKARINPHFLFNSLNGIASMAEDNDKVVDYVQNLSDLLRYSFKESVKELVSLNDELEMLSKYISLQKTRFGNSMLIYINTDENCRELVLPPLALQMLVENCIKHNIISKDNPLRIDITAENEALKVKNNLNPKKSEPTTGEGFAIISGRYRYFTTRRLEVENDGKSFTVTIPLLKIEK